MLLESGLGLGNEALEDLGPGLEQVRLVGPPAFQEVLGPAQARLESALAIALEGRIERRVDLEPGPVKAVEAVVLLEVAADLLEEVGPELDARAPQGQDLHRPLLEGVSFGPGQVAFGDHPVEDMVATFERDLGFVVGRIDRRAAEDAGDRGGLDEVEVLDVLAEEEIGRGLNAVSPVAEVEVVAVELEDLLFGVDLLDLPRDPELLELAPEADLPVEEYGAGQLLGDGAAALGPLAAQDLEHVGPEGPQNAPHIHAAVAEEAGVLGGHDGIDERPRQPAVRDLDALLLGEFLEQLAVGGVDRGDELGPEAVDIGDVRQVVLDGDIGAEDSAQPEGQPGQHQAENDLEDGLLVELLDLELQVRDLHGVFKPIIAKRPFDDKGEASAGSGIRPLLPDGEEACEADSSAPLGMTWRSGAERYLDRSLSQDI